MAPPSPSSRPRTPDRTGDLLRPRDRAQGTVVLGRYTVQRVLGRGGMATVYLARHQQTDRLVALKLLDTDVSQDPLYVERFRREARAAGRIRSDNVVAIYDLDAEVGGSLVLVMEYLEGETVQNVLRVGAIAQPRALPLAQQLLAGLSAAHDASVIHRDLKPANLFVERLPMGGERLKILDFGISKLADLALRDLTRDGQTLGTVAFMAPEAIRGKAARNDPRVDVYSAGVSIFMMLTGKRPIDADDPVQLLGAVLESPPLTLAQAAGRKYAPALEQFVAKALQKDPEQRFQTAREMHDALVAAASSTGVETTGGHAVVPTRAAVTEPAGTRVADVDAGPPTETTAPVPTPAAFVEPAAQVRKPAANAGRTMMGIGAPVIPQLARPAPSTPSVVINDAPAPPPAVAHVPAPTAAPAPPPLRHEPVAAPMPAHAYAAVPLATPPMVDPFGPVPGARAVANATVRLAAAPAPSTGTRVRPGVAIGVVAGVATVALAAMFFGSRTSQMITRTAAPMARPAVVAAPAKPIESAAAPLPREAPPAPAAPQVEAVPPPPVVVPPPPVVAVAAPPPPVVEPAPPPAVVPPPIVVAPTPVAAVAAPPPQPTVAHTPHVHVHVATPTRDPAPEPIVRPIARPAPEPIARPIARPAPEPIARPARPVAVSPAPAPVRARPARSRGIVEDAPF